MADKYVETILESWNLECLIPKFKDEKIDKNAFRNLNSCAISLLIPTKDLKMMFKSKYKQYKTPQLARGTIDDLTSSSHTDTCEEVDMTNEGVVEGFQPKSESQASSFDIEFILQESFLGRKVINTYKMMGRLDYNCSLTLAQILVDYLITQSDDFRIDNDVLNEIADAIVITFPNEKKETYYRCIGEQIRGVLVECYRVARRKLLRKDRLKRKKTLNSQTISKSDFGSSQQANLDQIRDNETPMPEWVEVNEDNEEVVNVKWTSHRDSLLQGLPLMLAEEKFVDTTVVCEGHSIKCHKIVLCSYSSFFEKMVASSPCKHPVIFLADLEFWEVQAIIDFMYIGELNIEENKLPRLFQVANKLNVKGLSNVDINEYDKDANMMETTSAGVEETDNQIEDPLSITRKVSNTKRRKQTFNNISNLEEPLVSIPTLTHNDDLMVIKKSKFVPDSENSKGIKKIKTESSPYRSPLPLNPTKENRHRLQSIPGKVWRLCDVCKQRGWKRYARYWCITCDVGVHQRCYYGGHKPKNL